LYNEKLYVLYTSTGMVGPGNEYRGSFCELRLADYEARHLPPFIAEFAGSLLITIYFEIRECAVCASCAPS